MRSVAVSVLLTLALLGCTTAPDRPADWQAISDVLHDWNTAWQESDAALAAAGYADDADFTNAFGFHRTGRAAIEEYLGEVFTFAFVMAGTSVDDSVEYRFIADDVALVRTLRTRTGQELPDGSELPPRKITHLRVFVREDGGWSIASHLISDARDTERPKH